tara:strand:- start:1168 stop:2592 length:1425 start_codon:yes stop_codon:yes gene_type:complete
MRKVIIISIIILLLIILYNYKFNLQFRVWLLNRLVISRGVLALNCKWLQISDLLIGDDSSGINLYNTYKEKYGDFAESNMYGQNIYTVTNNKYIKTILDNSPDLFNVGKLKNRFFKSFMSKNVGVSSGCPWKSRRQMNEFALDTNRLHQFASKYNNDIKSELLKWKNKKKIDFDNFSKFGNKIVAKVIFNTDKLDDEVFKIFSEANSIEVFHNPDFKINPKIYKKYLDVLNHFIDRPNEQSLIKLCVNSLKSVNYIQCPSITDNKDEIIHQIPHLIFPINGLFITTIPRLLLLLCNHPNTFKKVTDEIYSLNQDNQNSNQNNSDISKEIYKLPFLRKCILETLRLNNPVITTFRTLEKDYTFDEKYSFKKGTQFLILNNPVLREKEYFEEPDKFIPSRWNDDMEKSYYSISFNQGPQICPAKELAIYLAQSFIYNFIIINNIGRGTTILAKSINTKKSPQIINPCKIQFELINK